MDRPDLCKTSLCQRWAKGACPLEAGECRFAHGHLDLRATPNFMHASQEDQPGQNGRDAGDYAGLDMEASLIVGGNNGNNNNHNRPHGLQLSQPPPRPWEEDRPYAGSAPLANPEVMPWDDHGNQQDEVFNSLDHLQALQPRADGQWSPEWGDGGLDGSDGRQQHRRSRRSRTAKTAPLNGYDNMGAAGQAAPAVPSNGRPPQLMPAPINGQQQPPPMQQMHQRMNGDGLQMFLEHSRQQPPPQGHQQQQQQRWGPLPGDAVHVNGWDGSQVWSDPYRSAGVEGEKVHQAAHAPLVTGPPVASVGGVHYSGGPVDAMPLPSPVYPGMPEVPCPPPPASYTQACADAQQGFSGMPEASEFPHAITAPGSNVMQPMVPQEVRAIWGWS